MIEFGKTQLVPEADPTISAEQSRAIVSEGYDAIAKRYTELAALDSASHPRRTQLARLLSRLPAGSRVLELGCGGGVPVAASIVDAGHSYVGVDISPRQIAIARSLVPGGEFLLGDTAMQEFDAATFDAVLMLYAITHVQRETWSELFAQIRRWLRPDGWLLVNVTHHESPGWLEEDFLGLGGTNWTNSYDSATSLRLLESAGFDVVEARRLGENDLDPEGWLWVLSQARGTIEPPGVRT